MYSASPASWSGGRLRIVECESLTTICVAPPSIAPSIAAFTSARSSWRPACACGPSPTHWSQSTTPAVPSISVDRKTFMSASKRHVAAAHLAHDARRSDPHASDRQAQRQLGDLQHDVLDRAEQRGRESVAADQLNTQPVATQLGDTPSGRTRRHQQVQSRSHLCWPCWLQFEAGSTQKRAERSDLMDQCVGQRSKADQRRTRDLADRSAGERERVDVNISRCPVDLRDRGGALDLIRRVDVDLLEIAAGKLGQERKTFDRDVRPVLQPLLLNLVGQNVLGN